MAFLPNKETVATIYAGTAPVDILVPDDSLDFSYGMMAGTSSTAYLSFGAIATGAFFAFYYPVMRI